VDSFDFNHLFGVPPSILQSQVYPKFKKFYKEKFKSGKYSFSDTVYWFIWPQWWKFVFLGSMIDISYLPLPILIKKLIAWSQGYMFDEGLEGEEYTFMTGLLLAFGISLCAYGLPFFDGFCDNFAYLTVSKIGTVLRVSFEFILIHFLGTDY
jgi:hypothetical protein